MPTWEGVTFGEAGEAGGADAGRVVRIILDGKGLTGSVPAAIGGLTGLRKLELSRNQLTSIPLETGRLTKVGRCRLTLSNPR